jgi:hypothetical protein
MGIDEAGQDGFSPSIDGHRPSRLSEGIIQLALRPDVDDAALEGGDCCI